jgi:hypothetical protein
VKKVMSYARLRSWRPSSIGNLLVTVELDPVVNCRTIQQHFGLANLTRQLVELADSLRLGVTWAVGDPAYSAATSLVTRSDIAHELAVLGDPNWLGPTAGRTRFARELARRVSHARAAGIDVVTLVPRVADVQRDIDLVIKQRIRAVAGVGDAAAARVRLPGPRALHYGVWELPVTCRLPLRRGWFSGSGRSVLRAIGRAARAGATFHLVIDAPAVEREGLHAENTVVRLLTHAAQLRDRGLMRCETLGAAAARLSDVPVASPQRSILRRAG